MSHEPVKLYAAAIIRGTTGLVLLTRHDHTSKWHLPDGVPSVGQSCHAALKEAIHHDFDALSTIEAQPCEVTEVITANARHVTLHFNAKLPEDEDTIFNVFEGFEDTWIDPSKPCDLPMYASTKIVLERLRTQS